ncbi:MAG: response regulator [Planctomycetes bacterium]|nr:response regulator [Planctomycetota bacterium]
MNDKMIGRAMEILLVEDSLMDAHVAMRAIRDGQIKHRLTLVVDGNEAIEFLHRDGKFARAPRPDMILLDLHLPGRDGLDVLAEIRSDPDLQRTPVVILTATGDHDAKNRCEHLRVDAFMAKPVNLRKFLDVVREIKRWMLEDVILPVTE